MKKKILFARLLVEIDSFAVSPPLGVISIIPVIKKRFPDFEIDLFDTGLPYFKNNNFVDHVKETRPDMICYSITYTERDLIFNVTKEIKKIFPEIVQIAGGIGITCSPDEFMKNSVLDYIVLSEGEYRLKNILENILSQTEDYMDGIGFRTDNGYKINPVESYIEDLDEIGIPAWEMVDLKTYATLLTRNTMLKKYPYATIMTNRGCPFKCPYCHRSLGDRIRFRGVENVIEELTLLKKLGVKEIHFLDDTFNLPEKNAVEIIERIIKEDFGFSIAFQGIRMDIISKRLLTLMKEAGTYNIEFGVQHVAPRISKQLNRKFDFENLFENVKYARELGIITQGHFIYGFPDETIEESKKNLEFALKLDSDLAAFFKLTPYPGTYYGNNYVKDYTDLSSKEFHFYSDDKRLNLSNIETEELYRFQNYSHKKFYLRPLKAIKIFFKIPKNRYFWKHIVSEFVKRFLLKP